MEEDKMSRNGFFYIALGSALLILVSLTIGTAIARSPLASSRQNLSVYALRHPRASIAAELTPEPMPTTIPDLSNWYLRRGHECGKVAKESTPDLADYAFRHPQLTTTTIPDLSNWYLRRGHECGR
jgi:hypothetical protein